MPFGASLLVVACAVCLRPAECRAAEDANVDPKQMCLLVREGFHPDDEFAATLAVHGKAVAGCLISEVTGHDPGTTRAEAASSLVQAMALAEPPLDAQTAQRAREVVARALRDRSVEVRVATVSAVAEFGDQSMVPALQAVAKSDPVLSLRDYTALAIERLRKRLAEQ